MRGAGADLCGFILSHAAVLLRALLQELLAVAQPAAVLRCSAAGLPRIPALLLGGTVCAPSGGFYRSPLEGPLDR